MASNHITKIYRDSNGDRMVVDDGGEVCVMPGGKITSDGVQPALISNAETLHALDPVYSDTEMEGALDDMGGKINGILAILKGAGLMASE